MRQPHRAVASGGPRRYALFSSAQAPADSVVEVAPRPRGWAYCSRGGRLRRSSREGETVTGFFLRGALLALGALAVVAPASADVKVTDQAYVRHDGGTDVTITDCSTNNRQQNEPSVAVDPINSEHAIAGSNDY